MLKEVTESDGADHPLHRRAAHRRRRGRGRRRDGRRATCSSRCWRAASCTASARPRSTSIASTSKKTPRWSAASSRSMVGEPTVEDTISILRGLRERYESITRCASRTPRWLPRPCSSHRYIADRFLPDKAIDLVDEAASRLRMEIDQHARRARRGRAGGSCSSRSSARGCARRRTRPRKERLEGIEQELANLKEQRDAARGAVAARAGELRRGRRASRKLEQRAHRARAGAAQRATGASAARLAVRQMPELEQQLRKAAEATRDRAQAGAALLKEEVDEEDIAEVVSKWTGVPVEQAARGRGREAAADGGAAARARRRPGRGASPRSPTPCAARAPGCRTRNRPLGSFLFLGPTGVGKTETGARAGRVPVRRRAGDGPHRHERVPGEAHRVAR